VTADDAPVRVLLVEDNDVYRESLVFLLKRVTTVDVVGAVADGNAAMRACIELHPDVVVLDYRLPDADGAEVFITLMCLKCHKMRPLSQFGLRKMADGAIRNQPWCRTCRHQVAGGGSWAGGSARRSRQASARARSLPWSEGR